MGLIDRLTSAGQQASAGARATVEEADLRRSLARAYDRLGRRAFALIEQGTLRDARLASASEEVRALERRLAAITAGRGDS